MRDEFLADICRQYKIAVLYAFGSRTKEADAFMHGQIEQLTPGAADLDLGILPANRQRMTIRGKIDLTSTLEDFFNVGRVDLVVLPEADPFLAANIIRGERLYADNETAADEYDLYILRRAGDLIPLEKERLDLILKGSP